METPYSACAHAASPGAIARLFADVVGCVAASSGTTRACNGAMMRLPSVRWLFDSSNDTRLARDDEAILSFVSRFRGWLACDATPTAVRTAYAQLLECGGADLTPFSTALATPATVSPGAPMRVVDIASPCLPCLCSGRGEQQTRLRCTVVAVLERAHLCWCTLHSSHLYVNPNASRGSRSKTLKRCMWVQTLRSHHPNSGAT